MAAHDFSRISPTAYYTGQVWYRHGLSHPALETRAGKWLFRALQPFMLASRAFSGLALEDALIARHRCLEYLLNRAVDGGVVGQVIEIGAGLSPRGVRMMRRFQHRKLVYIEGDLPAMAAAKRERLSSVDALRPGHHVVELDALADAGARSLEEVAREYLDPRVGTAILTEGLINYFDGPTAATLWQRIARVLRGYPSGVYMSDMYHRDEVDHVPGAAPFATVLAAFTRGRVYIHFADETEANGALAQAGFARATNWRVSELAEAVGLTTTQTQSPVRVVEAWV